ncbi:MAG: hypothetical protein FWD16_05195, partial [Clostridia bacterium]|nr:hypothetical protein [Clostridia bacterium]
NLRHGQSLPMGGGEAIAYIDYEEDMACLRVTLHGVSFLFMGDLTAKGEQRFLEEELSLEATVLMVPHHGSKYSSSGEFLHAVRASQAWISAGLYNSYGHPTPETLGRLANAGAFVRRTDFEGSYALVHRNGKWRYTTDILY